MFHPHGQHPASVYWRRRLVTLAGLAVLVVLLVLTAHTLFASKAGEPAATGTTGTTASSTPPPNSETPPAPTSTATDSATPRSTPPGSSTTAPAPPGSTPSGSHTAALPNCVAAQRSIQAVPAQPSYTVGSEPVLALRVTNTGSQPCIQDVADQQIVLLVYNGASRVWGSHDCVVTPGTDLRTLLPNQPASFSVTWTGLSSQPGCQGQRQRVGAGTYTLYASLSNQNGTAATFEIK
jgi:hypothetical protein